MLEQSTVGQTRLVGKSGQIGVDRASFWKYCVQTAGRCRARAIKGGFPCSIGPHDVDRLLVDQGWRCAISGLSLIPPDGKRRNGFRQDPFGPSLDRISPRRGYVPGNIRIVAMMVNAAMNEWGAENFKLICRAVASKQPRC